MTVTIGQDNIGYYVRVTRDNNTICAMEVGIKTKKQARMIASVMYEKFAHIDETARITDKT